jgi:hypothetical protein
MNHNLLAAISPLRDIYAPASPYPTDTNSVTITQFLNPILNFAIIAIGLSAFFTLLLAGFNYITSNGDKNKVELATQMFTYAIIGLVLIAASFIITNIIGGLVGGGFSLI